ncbi:MAG: hypothetical protein P4L53_23545 [Candidatus Obscuribacterales bacterium]|nr:hypothetical protein [Candidatus Obscuribacterales bacterium]
MRLSGNRNKLGLSQLEMIMLLGVLATLYFGYQYLVVYKEPNQLVNKDFECIKAGGVPAFQNPHLLAEYLKLNSVSARFAAPDKAIENAAARDRVTASGLVDLNGYTPNTPLTERRNPLVVRVMDTYTAEKGVLLLRVRVLNKTHQNETWYIAADKINPLANVTGFADKAAKMHRPGIDDLLESKPGRKLLDNVVDTFKKEK